MIVSIHQPGYLPWHGLFHRLAISDLHVFFDSTQFEKNGFNNRVKIKTPQGGHWLTVPVRAKGRFQNNPINRAEINNSLNWRATHRKTLDQNYAKAPFREPHGEFLATLFSRPWDCLGDLNTFAVEHLARALGVRCLFRRASELNATGEKGQLVVNICKAVGATTYISGVNGRAYLRREDFEREGIRLRFQSFREPNYQQLHGKFLPYLSIVDLLFNEGPRARDVLMAGQDTIETGTVVE